jgi:hypothetical protein
MPVLVSFVMILAFVFLVANGELQSACASAEPCSPSQSLANYAARDLGHPCCQRTVVLPRRGSYRAKH